MAVHQCNKQQQQQATTSNKQQASNPIFFCIGGRCRAGPRRHEKMPRRVHFFYGLCRSAGTKKREIAPRPPSIWTTYCTTRCDFMEFLIFLPSSGCSGFLSKIDPGHFSCAAFREPNGAAKEIAPGQIGYCCSVGLTISRYSWFRKRHSRNLQKSIWMYVFPGQMQGAISLEPRWGAQRGPPTRSPLPE